MRAIRSGEDTYEIFDGIFNVRLLNVFARGEIRGPVDRSQDLLFRRDITS